MLKKSNQKGFTIIEVLIVLAIAGLIMLIVFLAVPALQRNSRNTQRKADVSMIQGAIQEYTNNNSGVAPTTYDQITNLAKLGFYDRGTNATTSAIKIGTANTAARNPSNINQVTFTAGTKCGASAAVAAKGGVAAIPSVNNSALVGSPRQGTLMYSVEDSSGNAVPQCVET